MPNVTIAVPHPVASSTPAQRLARVCAGTTALPLCWPRGPQRRGRQRGTCPALGAGQQGGRVCGARRPADAHDQPPAGSSPQRHRAEVIGNEGVPSSRREPAGVSHGARTFVSSHPLSASRPACREVWCGSGRRTRTDTRLVPQCPNPHLGRLSLSGASLYHVIRWSVENLIRSMSADSIRARSPISAP